jgi:hypothetical protein
MRIEAKEDHRLSIDEGDYTDYFLQAGNNTSKKIPPPAGFTFLILNS